jgi:hypothetical protein
MFTIIQRMFTGGELSPMLDARSDQTRYKSGGRLMKNAWTYPHGALTRRPGFIFVAPAGNQEMDIQVRLLPFIFSSEQAYALEFGIVAATGLGYMRPFVSQGPLWVDETDAAIDDDEWTDQSDGDSVAVPGENIAPVMAADSFASLGAGWAYDDGLHRLAGTTASTAAVLDVALVSGTAYTVTMLLDGVSAGSVKVSVPGEDGTSRDADGLYSEELTPTSDGALTITGTGFTGAVVFVVVQEGNGEKGLWLFCSGGDEAAIEQAVTHTSDGVQHLLAFQVDNGPLNVRIGTTSGADDILEECSRGEGYHTLAFTPPAGNGTFYLQFGHSAGDSYRSASEVRLLSDVAVEVPTPFTDPDQLFLLDYDQSGDVMFLVQKGIYPHRMMRYGHTMWSCQKETIGPSIDPPQNLSLSAKGTPGSTEYSYVATSVSEETGEESLRSLAVTITNGNDTLDDTNYNELLLNTVLKAKHYNIYRLKNGLDCYLGRSGDGMFHDTGQNEPNDEQYPPLAKDPFEDESRWPETVAFFEQRIAYGRALRINMSQTAIFSNFNTSSPLKDNDGCAFRISSSKSDSISWMVSGPRMFIGTPDAEWTVQGSSGDPITPSNPDIKRQTQRGSAKIKPLVVGSSILFVQSGGRVIREMKYSLEQDAWDTSDLSILSEHMLEEETVIDWCYQQSPFSTVWIVTSGGRLLSMHYNREHEIIGWSRHETDGLFESCCCIPRGGEDELWVVVRRYVNGAWARNIEVMADLYRGEHPDGGFFVDSGVILDSPVDIIGFTLAAPPVVTAPAHGLTTGDVVRITGVQRRVVVAESGDTPPSETVEDHPDINLVYYNVTKLTADTVRLDTNYPDGVAVDATGWSAWFSGGELRRCMQTITGLDHLEGKQVQILADGSEHTSRAVASGSVTLDAKYGNVRIGLPYVTDFIPMAPDGTDDLNTIQGKVKRINKAWARVYRTLGMKYGPSKDELRTVLMRDALIPGGVPTPCLTAILELEYDGGYDPDAMFLVRADKPLPFTLVGLMLELEVGE